MNYAVVVYPLTKSEGGLQSLQIGKTFYSTGLKLQRLYSTREMK